MLPTQKVEIGFDLTSNNVGPYFRLDDPVRGVLDNTQYILGGTIFFDVTDKVKGFSIQRGKSRQLDRYSTGRASVLFDNNSRDFDPEFEASPYFGQIIPRREVRITSGTVVQYFGSADDWNLDYAPEGDNIAQVVLSDGFRALANQVIENFTPALQTSGERINTILNRPEINWPSEQRNVSVGVQELAPTAIGDGKNALAYLQAVEASEPGRLFISKAGAVRFIDRNEGPNSDAVILADDGTGIPYTGMKVVYGSELLFNEIILSNAIGTAIANNEGSQGEYGISSLSQSGLLINGLTQTQELAEWYSTLFANPEFRFESVEIFLNTLTEEQQEDLLALELGDTVQVKFTPGKPATPPPIVKFAEIIKLDHAVDQTSHRISIGFQTLDVTFFVLDDAVFGRLNEGALGL
jgi:hypothetical protein